MTASPAADSGRVFYPRLESLRGLAAFSVLLCHIFENQITYGPALAQDVGTASAVVYFAVAALCNGSAAVLLFFVLSGFVMGVNVDTARPLTPVLYGRFLLRRAFRLFPVVIVSVLLAVAINSVASGRTYETAQIVDFLLLRDISLNFPLWSVTVEIHASCFYLLALFALAKAGAVGRAGAVAAAALVCLLDLYPVFYGPYLIAFALGLVVPTYGRALMAALGARRATLLVPVVFVLLYAHAPVTLTFKMLSEPQTVLMAALGAFYIISYVTYALPARPCRLLDAGVSTWLGRISYSVYALHIPIVFPLGRWVAGEFGAYPALARTFILLAMAVPLVLAAAHVVTAWVEQPLIRIGKKLAAPRPSDIGVETAARRAG